LSLLLPPPQWVAGSLQRVMIECGDWTGCKLGDNCPQRRVRVGGGGGESIEG